MSIASPYRKLSYKHGFFCRSIKKHYTHYVQGIDRLLRDALVEDGWKIGFYTGEDNSGLVGFLEGDVDILIGSSAIGTGVDGLQRVCNRLIVNVLPWTRLRRAEFEQLRAASTARARPTKHGDDDPAADQCPSA